MGGGGEAASRVASGVWAGDDELPGGICAVTGGEALAPFGAQVFEL